MARVDALQALGIERVEVDREARIAHLDGFVNSFVLPEYRDRVSQKANRGSWVQASREIEKWLDPARCRLSAEHSRPERFPEQLSGRGVYIASSKPALEMSVVEASSLSISRCEDAIFSVSAGELAVFLNHDWGVWYCEAPNKRLQRTPLARRR